MKLFEGLRRTTNWPLQRILSTVTPGGASFDTSISIFGKYNVIYEDSRVQAMLVTEDLEFCIGCESPDDDIALETEA